MIEGWCKIHYYYVAPLIKGSLIHWRLLLDEREEMTFIDSPFSLQPLSPNLIKKIGLRAYLKHYG